MTESIFHKMRTPFLNNDKTYKAIRSLCRFISMNNNGAVQPMLKNL